MTHDAARPDQVHARRPQFDVALRGYERTQVDEHLSRLEQETNQLAMSLRQERDLALRRAQVLAAERDDALDGLRGAQAELSTVRAAPADAPPDERRNEISLFGDRLQTILATAEQEANQVKADADEHAGQARAAAEEHAAQVKAAADRHAAEVQAAADEAAAAARADADAYATRTKTDADAYAARVRAEADQAAETVRAEARAEADALVTQATGEAEALVTNAAAEAEKITSGARDRATTMVDTARREEADVRGVLADLVTRRDQVRGELGEIGSALERLLSGAVPKTQEAVSAGGGDRTRPAAREGADPTS